MKRNLDGIITQIEELKKYLGQNKNILALYIFGSYGTGHERTTSDIDLAILFRNSPSLFEELEIESGISQIFKRDDIDLVNLNKAPIDICHQVLHTGELLYCTDEIALADFKERVFNIYGDYGITLKKFYDDFMKGLRDKYV
ncbi:DNA polymerase beta domain protein region [Thermosediminibacter oceani DSM 16646]|uniref:DNA polymerase beta domain protein region n=1 Tax=Thermosediminibacter oceani (strain ATCC BAA-1034 / DSM 16646 / JW/IW-1228P) TaxID=555079 RepID=D9RZB2_THEOJ|nr:nucleotidyltransferase domain-containing protein [Thermosediminibacter oceani]ADL08666.1 DNA polymerase beta domain protein region [Thermosediminibacter oceani DSM 16646]